jgi:hypothetical protein
LADLLLENRSFARAALEYEKTAYEYPGHEKLFAAGYAAIYAYREQLAAASPEEKDKVKRETVASSLKFAATFPKHEKAAIVLGAAAADLYDMKDSSRPSLPPQAHPGVPGCDREVLKSAWVVSAIPVMSSGVRRGRGGLCEGSGSALQKTKPGRLQRQSYFHLQAEQANALRLSGSCRPFPARRPHGSNLEGPGECRVRCSCRPDSAQGLENGGYRSCGIS